MKDVISIDFQDVVDETLARNKSLLDILSKYQDANARINRAVIKASTHCGCIELVGHKQPFSQELPMADMAHMAQSMVTGTLCESCRESIEQEIGRGQFYLAALCNALDISMYDTMVAERHRLEVLGRFNLR